MTRQRVTSSSSSRKAREPPYRFFQFNFQKSLSIVIASEAKQSRATQTTLDCFASLAMTGNMHPHSRGTKCPSCWKRAALEIRRGRRECRMRVAPEAACAAKSTRVSNQGYTATAGIPCTMVLTVSFVLSPVTMLGCHRHQWNRFHQLSACIGAPGPHDFAVRTNAARRATIALGDVRPSHPAPNVRDDREPPLFSGTRRAE